MRALALLAALSPVAAASEPLAETHFRMNFCWETGPGAAEPADRPAPAVSAIRLHREPAGWPVAPGRVAMEVTVTFRGADGGREGDEAQAVAECRGEDDRLRCLLSGRAGEFGLEAQGEGGLMLVLGEAGMRLDGEEGQVLRGEDGEERTFALRRCG